MEKYLKTLFYTATVLTFIVCRSTQAETNCTPTAFTIRGSSMAPLLHKGQVIAAFAPSCTTITHGDLIIFTTSANKRADVIKRVVGIAGDQLALAPNGSVLINKHPALAPNNQPYIASSQGLRMLKLYTGTIPEGRYLVLGKPNTLDSTRIGLIRHSQVTGVVKANTANLNSDK